MNGRRLILFLTALIATVILLLANVYVQSRLDSIIREDSLVDAEYVDGAPPVVAFTTVALGGFRGIIADFLWLRTISLQEQGKYFELAQLASWITKLQPKSTAAAAYLGWNMAYNISVTCQSPEDRWRWVHRGIEVLQEALRYNPNDPELYKELGWIYQHKLGNVLDDAQRYYKYEMARIFLHAYGAHYPDWEALAAAPKTESELKEKFPPDHPLWKIMKAWGFESLNVLLERFEFLGKLPPDMESVPPSLAGDESVRRLTAEELETLSLYLRARWLRTEYIIDPQVVADINRNYGELDWLLPESFAIYWATQGIAYSPMKADTNSERMIVQSLQVSFSNGRMLLPGNQASMYFMLVPNLALVDAVKRYYDEVIERNPDVPSFKHAREYFYTDAAVLLYSYGQYTKSREYYNLLRREFKGNKANRLDFDAFILTEWTEDIVDASYKQANDYIPLLIFRSCVLLGYGDREAAAGHLRMARFAYDKYHSSFSDTERMALPPFDVMKSEVTKACMEAYPFLADRLKAEILSENPESSAPAADASSAPGAWKNSNPDPNAGKSARKP